MSELERIARLEAEAENLHEDIQDLKRSIAWMTRFTVFTLAGVILNLILLFSGVHV